MRVLASSERFDAGRHSPRWEGRDDVGRALGSGIYFVKLRAGGVEGCRKAELLK